MNFYPIDKPTEPGWWWMLEPNGQWHAEKVHAATDKETGESALCIMSDGSIVPVENIDGWHGPRIPTPDDVPDGIDHTGEFDKLEPLTHAQAPRDRRRNAMSDRIKGFTVVLREPMKDEDAQRVKDAILLLSPVGSVIPLVADGSDWVAKEMALIAVREQLMDVLYPHSQRGTP